MIRTATVTALAVLGAACSARQLTPPAAPTQEPPAVDRGSIPPEPGTGQVILDAVDGTADVDEVLASSYAFSTTGHAALGMTTARVCTTPCIVNLPYGDHEVRFHLRGDVERTSTEFINVTTTPTIHRVAIGAHRTHPMGTFGGILMATMGSTAGLVSLGIGAGTDNSALIGVGVGSLVVGVLGLVLMNSSRDEHQPGSMTSWPAD